MMILRFNALRFKVASKNILKHRLRSLLIMCTIAGAVCAIVMFHGLTDYLLGQLKHIAADSQYGNMQIAQNKYWDPHNEKRREKLFPLSDLELLKNKNLGLNSISGRLSFYGLVSNGDMSTSAKVIGIDPDKELQFKKSLRITKGLFLKDGKAKEGVVGRLLAKQMGVKPGDEITIVSNTIDGVMNALDIKVVGIFSAGLDEIDSQVVYVPLDLSQNILDTKDVDVGVVTFDNLSMVDSAQVKINGVMKESHKDLKAKSWRELAGLYRQVEKFYIVQNYIIESILLSLVFLGILNAVSMAVIERIGEMGIMRSLGETQADVVAQFVLENFILTLCGIVLGTVLSYVLIQIIKLAEIYTEMPGASEPILIEVNFLWNYVFYASALAVVTSFLAAYLPANRASKFDIVEALRKNI